MDAVTVGWVGLGNMGLPMANNLLRAGYPLRVYNRTAGKAAALVQAGAIEAQSLQDLATACSVIITMVSDDAAVRSVYDELLQQPGRSTLFIDMSTVGPATSEYLVRACAEQGALFLDAPVSGSVKPATEGTLLILAGGSEAAFQEGLPLLKHMGRLVLHLGANGSGSRAKLAINYLLGLQVLGLAETVRFAEQSGIARDHMLTIINESAVGNGLSKLKTTSLLEDRFPAAFALKHMEKDLRLAGAAGLSAPLYAPLYEQFRRAVSAGLGEEDVMAIFKEVKASN